ncbi:hypothetical protein BSKO_01798 [Bryopsis sp. KO-2023]|nr:hypothetical protein BSKO_01798 [Bryopsis sp. KO-2023]
MVKKGKGKGGGKTKAKDETEEERAARLKMEGIAAQEQARKQDEQNRVALRLKQIREQRYAHINNIKIHNQWRKIKRMSKVEELKRDIEIIAQNHEREVDRKDAILQMLDRDLEDAEEQYSMALRGHYQIVDSLQDLQHMRMQALDEDFSKDLETLETQFETEKNEIISVHNKQVKDMTDMMNAMEQEFSHAEGEARQEFESQREEVKNRNSEEYNVLKIQLEGTIEELERHFEQAHKVYLDSTEHRTQAFKKLTKNDAAAARVIERRMRKLIRLQDALGHWRNKIASSTNEWEERNRALRNEKDIMTRHYRALKSSMDHFRATQSQRLKHLSICSGQAQGDLETKLQKATAILKLAEMCRKMETEQEKILPFCPNLSGVYVGGSKVAVGEVESDDEEEKKSGDPGVPPKEDVAVDASAADSSIEAVGGKLADKPRYSSVGQDKGKNEVEEWDYLNNFFKKFNKVMLDKGAIDKERDRLKRENTDLRAILKQYLDGISVNVDVMNNPSNTLMVVNQRLQLTLGERNKARAERVARKQQQQLVVQKAN